MRHSYARGERPARTVPSNSRHPRRSAAILLALVTLLILSGCTLAWAVPGGGALTALLVGVVALIAAACTSSGGGGGGNGGTVTVINGHVDEGSGATTMTLTIARSGGSGNLSVSFQTADGTAVAGTDYTTTSGSVNVGADATATVEVPVSPTDDGAFTGARWFKLALTADKADKVTDGAGIIHEKETTLDLGSLPSSLGIKIGGQFANDEIGTSVSGAGDFNGDGIDDLIIGAAYGTFYESTRGGAFVIFGKASGWSDLDLGDLSSSQGMSIAGADYGDEAGSSVRAAGDVNDDGYADVIVGAPFAFDNSGADYGGAYIILGGSSSPASLDLSSLSTSDGIEISGQAAGDNLGTSVSAVGDFNDDGIDDVIVGAPNAGGFGEAYVIFGKASGLADVTAPPSSGDGITIDSSTADNTDIGYSVSAAGDIDGDGIADVIVTDNRADQSASSYVGKGYVLLGRSSPGDIDLYNLSASAGITIRGDYTYSYLGGSASGVGDTNGDGLDDVLISAKYGNTDRTGYSGDAHLLFGNASPSDRTVPFTASQGVDFHNLPNSYEGAPVSVGPAGDVNGDGLADVILGNPGHDIFYNSASYYDGQVTLVFGADGTQSDLTMPPGSGRGFTIEGPYLTAEYVGWSVSGAGDVNGDGFGDLLIGAPKADPNERISAGVVYVIFGPF